MKRPEQEIQIAVMNHVRLRSMPGVFVFHVPNAGKRSLFMGSIMKQIGVTAGVPDLIFLYRGQSFGLELKASKSQKPSEDQVAVMNAMEVAGARTAVAHSLDEALVTLECWGVLRRDSSHRVPNQIEESAGAM